MAIMAKSNKSDFQVPPEGLYQAVCVDVTDVGMQPTSFGDKQKIDIRWMIGEVDESTGLMHIKLNDNGFPFIVFSRYTNSLHEKSNLAKHIQAWRGKSFTPEEMQKLEEQGMDLEKLIGSNCQLQLVHNLGKNGTLYCNVQAIVTLDKRLPKLSVPKDYVRVQDRKPKGEAVAVAQDDPDSDIPF